VVYLKGSQYVALGIDGQSTIGESFFQRKGVREDLVLHPKCIDPSLSLFWRGRHDEGDRSTDHFGCCTHGRQDRLVPAVRTEAVLARNILRSEDTYHILCPDSSLGVQGDQTGVRVGAARYPSVQHSGHCHVFDVAECSWSHYPAGHFLHGIRSAMIASDRRLASEGLRFLLTAQPGSGESDRHHDPMVAGAAAEIALQSIPDLLCRRIEVAVEQRLGRHQHTRCAIAALHSACVNERRLQRVQVVCVPKALHRLYPPAGGLSNGGQAGANLVTVKQHGTGAALTFVVASLLGPG
jgi:hypothetical protein